MHTTTEIIAKLEADCIAGWPGRIGEGRAADVRALLDRVLPEYAAVLGLTTDAILNAIEADREVNAVNHYQEANFPKLDDVTILDTMEAFKVAFPSGKYICPSCGGHSTDPFKCNAGTVRDTKRCDWKAYGLFGTMGKGLRIVVKSTFLEAPRVHEIFMPVEAVAKESV